jgi:leucyl-tRNA synthetase
VQVSPDVTETDATAAALADEVIAAALAGATPTRVVAVPPRLVNVIL